MKITFQNSPDVTADSTAAAQHTPRHRAQGCQSVGKNSGIRMDLRGADRFLVGQPDQVNAFAQIQQAAGAVDAEVQQDYMTLMSNTMSEEDYAKLMEDGFEFRQMDPEEAVTILDKIKAELAKAGIRVKGYNDDLDMATLEAALGSASLAQALVSSFYEADLPLTEENIIEIKKAWDMALCLEPPTDGTYQFMVKSRMPAEIENFYLAQSSGAASGSAGSAVFYEEEIQGYFAQAAGKTQSGPEVSTEELQEQIDRVIRESGREVDQESRESAQWLMSHNLPLTPEHLDLYEELTSAVFPVTEEAFARAVSDAVLEGKSPIRANLTRADEESVYEKANRLMEKYETGEWEAADSQELADRRLLEEIRLRMTTEVNLRLLRSGFSIDTSSMEEFVEALKTVERQIAERYFPGDAEAVSKYENYQAVNRTVSEIPGMPAGILGLLQIMRPPAETEPAAGTEPDRKPETESNIGAAADQNVRNDTEELTTLSEMYREGRDLQHRLERAGESYETLMTAPRADMGDSIRKAFANVDAILEELGLEVTEENRKAVRVLGYNRMDLSLENIQNVREAQRVVENVITKMTPASVLKMIRDGINPLEKNFQELEEYFDGLVPDYDHRAENYSRFLYRMEKRKDISREERESFVGIYRMLHQIEKKDGAAIGAVLNTRAELGFSGLLSAARSGRFASMDIRLSDQEKSFVEFMKGDNSIDDQIETAYLKQELEEIRGAAKASGGAREMLQKGEIPMNVDHLLAAEGLLNEEMIPFEKARKYLTKNEDSAVAGTSGISRESSPLDQLLGLWEEMDTPETFREDYREKMGELEEAVREETWQAQTSLDVKELRLLSKQLSITGALSEKEEYYLPLEVDGRTARLHLTLEQGEGERGKVTVEVETDGAKTRAQFWLSDGKVTGILQGNGQQELMKLSRVSDIFSGYLREESTWSMDAKLPVADMAKVGDVTAAAVRGNKATDKRFENAAKEIKQTKQPDQRDLFRLAKMWIRAVTQKEVENENQL